MPSILIRGIETAYDDIGSGQPVVLLHGYPLNRSMWREQVDALSVAYRVITPDLRGHGDSAVGPTATMDEMAQDVAALLDELEISSMILGGLSMGGYVALAFCRRFSSRVRALVLSDTKAQADSSEGRQNREQQAQKILESGMESVADDMLKKLVTPATLAGRPEIVESVRNMIVNTDPRGAAAALRGMADRLDQTNYLPEIKAPALIVVGSEDNLTPVADAQSMHQGIRGSSLEVIQGAAHLPNAERSEEFNRVIKRFLDELGT